MPEAHDGLDILRHRKYEPHVVQVYEVGTQTMLSSGAVYPVYQLMKDNGIADGNEDTDSDGLTDGLEATLGSKATDDDSDDDGLLDGDEPNPGITRISTGR